MGEDSKIMSKVLVHETDETLMESLKQFFQDNNLIGLKAERHQNVVEVLKSSIDLGAILLCEDMDSQGESGLDIIPQIHQMRQELPIFLRRKNTSTLDDLAPKIQHSCAGAYIGNDFAQLKTLFDNYLFNMYYPSSFIRGIEEMSQEIFQSTFKDMTLSIDIPYLVKDRIIYGELFSLMAIEGSWCRGFMMLQTEEKTMLDLIREGKTALSPDETDFREVNSILSEIANMMWGTFKTRFFSGGGTTELMRTQVPILINHGRRYISFGSENPQLCFRYTLRDPNGKLDPIEMFQKFVFHLAWSPEEFQESAETMDNLVDSGELEFF